MPGRKRRPPFGLDAVVEAVRQRVRDSSIRAVAAEIGMSSSGLHVLLRGNTPQAATRAKLVAWYFERSRSGSDGVSSRDVDAAIRLIVQYVVEDGRADARSRRLHEIIRRFETAVATEGKTSP